MSIDLEKRGCTTQTMSLMRSLWLISMVLAAHSSWRMSWRSQVSSPVEPSNDTRHTLDRTDCIEAKRMHLHTNMRFTHKYDSFLMEAFPSDSLV